MKSNGPTCSRLRTSLGIGSRPALLIIDVQYRTVGTQRLPFWEAVKEFPTSCGEVAWDAVENIAKALAVFRERGWPVLYPYVSPKRSFDRGRLSDKVPAIMNIAQKGYEFVPAIAPRETDILLPKKHPSAFFGTPLASYLINLGADTLVVTGCSTSGCVRGSIVDAFAYNFRVPCSARRCLRQEQGFARRQSLRYGGKVRGRGHN